jgi:hypothetical protein
MPCALLIRKCCSQLALSNRIASFCFIKIVTPRPVLLRVLLSTETPPCTNFALTPPSFSPCSPPPGRGTSSWSKSGRRGRRRGGRLASGRGALLWPPRSPPWMRFRCDRPRTARSSAGCRGRRGIAQGGPRTASSGVSFRVLGCAPGIVIGVGLRGGKKLYR